MKKQSIKKRIFNFSTFLTSLVTVPLLLFMTVELFKAHDGINELKIKHEIKYDKLETELNFYSNLANDIFHSNVDMKDWTIVTVDATAYSASVEECNSEPHITANGTLSTVGRIAVSRDLLEIIPHGSYVFIPNHGVFLVADSMNKRFTKRIDILLGNKKAARLFGLKKNVKLYYFKG